MSYDNGLLIESHAIPIPASVLSMMKRSLSAEDFANFSAVQLFSITYMSQGLRIKGFMALPPANQSGVYPGVVFNRGGAGTRGALTPEGACMYAGLYASWGYVAVASNYRGQGGSEGKEEWGAGDIADAKNSLTVLSNLGYVDMNRVGLVGGSRGGMMAYMMLRTMTNFRAAVTIGAPSMLHELDAGTYIRKTFAEFIANSQNTHQELVLRSAKAWAEELCKSTPLLILHGTGDRRVTPEHSLHLALRLQETQHPYRLIMYENADHILAGRREESNRDIRWWLDTYVRDSAPLPKTGPHGA
jgi:dipeptidyl aminopeptidase/acylaminoacyl peptidase